MYTGYPPYLFAMETIENLEAQLKLALKEAKELIAEVLTNPKLIIFLSESENGHVVNLLRQKELSGEDGWKIHNSNLAYNFTVKRADRDGWDSDSMEWTPSDMGCSCSDYGDGDDCLSGKFMAMPRDQNLF